MASEVIFSHLALEDMEMIVEYYLEKDRRAAQKYYQGIRDAVKNLTKFPEVGRLVPELRELAGAKYRELIFDIFRIVYRIEGQQVLIVRVIDSRQLMNIEGVKENVKSA